MDAPDLREMVARAINSADNEWADAPRTMPHEAWPQHVADAVLAVPAIADALRAAERLRSSPSDPPLMQVDHAHPVPSSPDSGESRSRAAGPESEHAEPRRAGAPPPEASSYACERAGRMEMTADEMDQMLVGQALAAARRLRSLAATFDNRLNRDQTYTGAQVAAMLRVRAVEVETEDVPLTQLVGRTIKGCRWKVDVPPIYDTDGGRWVWSSCGGIHRFPDGTLDLATGLVTVLAKGEA